MIEISRFGGVARVVLALVVCLGLIDVSLTGSVGYLAKYLASDELPTDDSVYEAVGARIAWTLSQPERPGLDGKRFLGVLFGQSTLGAGIDPLILQANDVQFGVQDPCWINLHGWGGSINKMFPLTELFLLSGLKPNIVVIAINPYMLIGHPHERFSRYDNQANNKFLKPYIWIYNNRYLANYLFRIIGLQIKLRLIQSGGLSLEEVYPPAKVPWESKPDKALPEFSSQKKSERTKYNRALGWYDAENYRLDNSNAQNLLEVIRRFRKLGSEVRVVLLPEHSEFRSELPQRSVESVEELLSRAFADQPVPLLNLRELIQDDNLFRDFDHLGYDGSVKTTNAVSQWLHADKKTNKLLLHP